MTDTPRSSRATRPSQALPERRTTGTGSRQSLVRDVVDTANAARLSRRSTVVPQPVRPKRTALYWACAILLTFSVWSLVARPAFLWGTAAAPLPPQVDEANTRMTMYVLAQRIEMWRADEGYYPVSLTEIGQTAPAGLEYVLEDDETWELRARGGRGGAIVLRSGDDARAFLRGSLGVLRGPRR